MEELKDRLIFLRKQNKLTQDAVATKISIKLSTYKAYETGRHIPRLEVLKSLANLYEVSLDFLCCRQYNNQVGYIPEDKKGIVKEILELQEKDSNEIYQYIIGYKKAKNY